MPIERETLFDQGGELGILVSSFDWSDTPIGPLDGWPHSLRTLVHMIVSSRHPMFLWWGRDLIQFYNDGYRPSLGDDRHPQALGARGEEFWGDIWSTIGPDIRGVMDRGESVWHEKRLVPITRNGRIEEVYWTYSYSPVLDDDRCVGGTLVTVQEVTDHVVGERRTSTLRALAERLGAEAVTAGDVVRVASDVLADATSDLPFTLLYLRDEDGVLRVASHLGDLPAAFRPSGAPIGEDSRSSEVWPLAEVFESGQIQRLGNLTERIGEIFGQVWPEPVEDALVVPVASAGGGRILGVLVAGLSPRVPVDDGYRHFVTLLARQVGRAVERAEEREALRQAETVARERLERAMEQAPAALCLLDGPEHVFTLANPLYLELIGNRDVIGKPAREALPDVEGQGYFELLDRVFMTGEPYVGTEERLVLTDRAGRSQERYVNFVYAPTRTRQGSVDGIFVHVYDVSAQVEARLLAEEAVRAREEFLSIASHELRNPAASLTGTAQFLSRAFASGRLTDARLGAYLEALDVAGRQLSRLIDDLLDVSRLHHGAPQLRPEVLDLVHLVREIVRRKEWSDRVVLRTEQTSIELAVDGDRIGQAVANLLENALKYSPEDESVQVALRLEDQHVLIEVIDQGIGLPPETLESIFTPFGRAPNATEANIPGLGLGLYVARRIAEQHGGRLTAASEGEGYGTTMSLRLPIRELAPADG